MSANIALALLVLKALKFAIHHEKINSFTKKLETPYARRQKK